MDDQPSDLVDARAKNKELLNEISDLKGQLRGLTVSASLPTLDQGQKKSTCLATTLPAAKLLSGNQAAPRPMSAPQYELAVSPSQPLLALDFPRNGLQTSHGVRATRTVSQSKSSGALPMRARPLSSSPGKVFTSSMSERQRTLHQMMSSLGLDPDRLADDVHRRGPTRYASSGSPTRGVRQQPRARASPQAKQLHPEQHVAEQRRRQLLQSLPQQKVVLAGVTRPATAQINQGADARRSPHTMHRRSHRLPWHHHQRDGPPALPLANDKDCRTSMLLSHGDLSPDSKARAARIAAAAQIVGTQVPSPFPPKAPAARRDLAAAAPDEDAERPPLQAAFADLALTERASVHAARPHTAAEHHGGVQHDALRPSLADAYAEPDAEAVSDSREEWRGRGGAAEHEVNVTSLLERFRQWDVRGVGKVRKDEFERRLALLHELSLPFDLRSELLRTCETEQDAIDYRLFGELLLSTSVASRVGWAAPVRAWPSCERKAEHEPLGKSVLTPPWATAEHLSLAASDTVASREKRLRRMSAIFNHFDVHERGRLDAHGFMQALRHMGREMSLVHKREKLFLNPDELSVLFREADTDQSGYIDYDEFVASLEKFRKQARMPVLLQPKMTRSPQMAESLTWEDSNISARDASARSGHELKRWLREAIF